MEKIGVVHGRFQVLHKDHMRYILEAKKRCERLIIGICNPDTSLMKYSPEAPHRSKPASNPLTYYEREECIRLSMIEYGIKESDFIIVPFPINFPEKILNYVPTDAVFYIAIYDKWGERKKQILEDELKLNVDVLWKGNLNQKSISSTDIRKKIANDEEWKDYVPLSVYQYISKNNLISRIKNLFFNICT